MATCRSCEAPVVWMRTKARPGKTASNIPVDAGIGSDDQLRPRSVPNGNLRLTGNQIAGRFGPVPEVEVVTPGAGTYVSHFSTCPNAKRHRRS